MYMFKSAFTISLIFNIKSTHEEGCSNMQCFHPTPWNLIELNLALNLRPRYLKMNWLRITQSPKIEKLEEVRCEIIISFVWPKSRIASWCVIVVSARMFVVRRKCSFKRNEVNIWTVISQLMVTLPSHAQLNC